LDDLGYDAADQEARVSSGDFVVDVPGGQLVGWQAGDGSPALILHGGPISDYTAPLAQCLPQLRTIRYQQRGLPPSTAAQPYTIEAHVNDAVAVLDAVGVERALIIGHSWGGHQAMHLAVAHPERVLGVIAVDTLGATQDGAWSDLGRNLSDRLEASDPETAALVAELDLSAEADEASTEDIRRLIGLRWPYYFADPAAAPPFPSGLQVNVELSEGVFMSVMEHYERGTLEQGLPGFRGPFHLIHGDQDPLPAETSRRTAALLPQATFTPIPNCGHFPWLEQRDAFLAALATALDQYR
jgi:pimeloyl-ACP methyl ester carboxylesterase